MDFNGSDSVGTEASATASSEASTDGGAVASSAVDRANKMRASLGARRDVEAMLAEASQLRQNAAADADAIVEEAQQISQALLVEGKQQADQITGESRERADGILARARAEAAELTERARSEAEQVRLDSERRADEHREQVRAEVAEQGRRELVSIRQQSHALIGEAETAVQGLGTNLEQASATIAQVLATLGQLRTSAVDPLPAPTADDAARFEAGVVASSPVGSFFAEPAALAVDEPVADVPAYAEVPQAAFPAVAAQAPAFDVPEPAPAEVPEPSVADFMRAADASVAPVDVPVAAPAAEVPVAEVRRAEVPAVEVPRAEVPEPSVASFAETPHAEVPRAEVRAPSLDKVDGPATREVPAVPAARREADTTSIFAAARDEQEADLSGATRDAETHSDLRDEGPAHRPADDRVVEETLEVMPEAEKRATEREPEPAARPLGWLFRSAQ